jgi:hypothetical protein
MIVKLWRPVNCLLWWHWMMIVVKWCVEDVSRFCGSCYGAVVCSSAAQRSYVNGAGSDQGGRPLVSLNLYSTWINACTPWFNVKESIFRRQSACKCFVLFSIQTAVISLHRISLVSVSACGLSIALRYDEWWLISLKDEVCPNRGIIPEFSWTEENHKEPQDSRWLSQDSNWVSHRIRL